jgi:hypothetical protein
MAKVHRCSKVGLSKSAQRNQWACILVVLCEAGCSPSASDPKFLPRSGNRPPPLPYVGRLPGLWSVALASQGLCRHDSERPNWLPTCAQNNLESTQCSIGSARNDNNEQVQPLDLASTIFPYHAQEPRTWQRGLLESTNLLTRT